MKKGRWHDQRPFHFGTTGYSQNSVQSSCASAFAPLVLGRERWVAAERPDACDGATGARIAAAVARNCWLDWLE